MCTRAYIFTILAITLTNICCTKIQNNVELLPAVRPNWAHKKCTKEKIQCEITYITAVTSQYYIWFMCMFLLCIIIYIFPRNQKLIIQKKNTSFNVISQFSYIFYNLNDMCKLIIKKLKHYKCLSLSIVNFLYNI